MVNDKDAAAPGDAPVEARTDTEKKPARGWLIGVIAAGAVLLVALAFAGGVATGFGISGLARTGLVAGSAPGQGPDGDGRQWGPGGPGQPGRQDGTLPDRPRRDDTETEPTDPAEPDTVPSPAPST